MRNLYSLFNSLGALSEIISAFLCQPRFGGSNSAKEVTGAGAVLEVLGGIVDEALADIRIAVKALPDEDDPSLKVFFAAEEWVDGSCEPAIALQGLTTALSDIGGAL